MTEQDKGIELGKQLLQLASVQCNLESIQKLVLAGAYPWLQEALSGWTVLHFAAEQGNTDVISWLLKHGAYWQITDTNGFMAGDVAFSMNHQEAYSALLNEAIRSEMLKVALGDDVEDDIASAEPTSAAEDNAVFLKTRLSFTNEGGQEVCLDAEGNAVMMGWETDIMQETARQLCQDHPNLEQGLSVVNIGHGLGIIDEALQAYKPKRHVIVEPHPDVIQHMRSKGWFERPGVQVFHGTWQEWLATAAEEPGIGCFDVIYWDTFSEHYKDLHQFFDVVPNLMQDDVSRFSFFHGLGATSRLLYDVYTAVSEMHLSDCALQVQWTDVPVRDGGETVWKGVRRRYWELPSDYRLPLITPGIM